MRLDHYFIRTIIPEAMCTGPEISATPSFVVDSRKVVPGDIFVALKGLQVDGHDFLAAALAQGASGVMIDHDKKKCLESIDSSLLKTITCILVPSSYDALLLLARAWRAQFSIPIVGVTGSVGKTTTKEYIANVMRAACIQACVSQGTLNTVIGVSLMILSMKPTDNVGVFEMGISKRGEMARMVDIVRPTTAVITTIGHSHMEGLGSLADIAIEKRAIFSAFTEKNIGIINGDVSVLSNVSYHFPVLKFGTKTINQIQARKIQMHADATTFVLKIYGERFDITLPCAHHGRVINALAAAAVSYMLGVPSATIAKALQEVVVVAGRYEKRALKEGNGFVINDSYNSNPESLKAALLAFEHIEKRGAKIAVIGDMLELGVNAAFWHRQVGRVLRKVPSLDHVIFVGSHIKAAQKTTPISLRCDMVDSWQDAMALLKKEDIANSAILVKGSRGMRLDCLVSEIC